MDHLEQRNEQICSYCKAPLSPTDLFCAKCGKRVIHPNETLKFGELLRIYVLSVIFAPFGIYWFFKYFRSTNATNRMHAYIVLAVNLGMLIFLIVANYVLLARLQEYMNSSLLIQ